MTYQPSGDSLIIDRVPIHNPAWKLRYEKQVKEAKKEGKKKCAIEGWSDELACGEPGARSVRRVLE